MVQKLIHIQWCNMNIKKSNTKLLLRVSIVVIVTIIFFLFLSFFLHSQLFVAISLDNQLNAMIASHNTSAMKQISQNEPTYQYILSLPRKTRCKNTSDFQGVISGYDYYVTVLNHKNVDVFMYKNDSNTLLKLYPQWQVSSIRVQTDNR